MPVSRLKYIQRIGICKECPDFKKLTAQCKVCGCLMHVKARLINDPTTGKGVKCPLGYWT